jgi:hypothetical protein
MRKGNHEMSISTLARPAFLGAPFQGIIKPQPGHELVTAADIGMLEPFAGFMPQGYNIEADVVTQTTDGRDLNDLWTEFIEVVRIHNERRQVIIDLLTFPVTQNIEDVPTLSGDDFEEASEFGVPMGTRTTMSYFSMAYDFKWYDIATRYTWKYLAEASAQQVESVHQGVLEADNRLVFKKVMNSLFRNTNRSASIKGQNYNVYALYNADGTVPPEYKATTFAGSHTHYLTSGAAVVDSGDVEALYDHVAHHGFSAVNGTQLLLMVNPQEGAQIRKFRANVTNNNAAVALYDFIPSATQPALIVPNAQGLIGDRPPSSINGLPVIGLYGPVLIVEEEYVPPGYMVVIGTGGEGNLRNPIGIREHANPNLRGLRLVPGNRQGYPLVESFYSRGFGTGIRQRGGSAVMQVTAGAYAIPAQYV